MISNETKIGRQSLHGMGSRIQLALVASYQTETNLFKQSFVVLVLTGRQAQQSMPISEPHQQLSEALGYIGGPRHCAEGINFSLYWYGGKQELSVPQRLTASAGVLAKPAGFGGGRSLGILFMKVSIFASDERISNLELAIYHLKAPCPPYHLSEARSVLQLNIFTPQQPACKKRS